MTNRVRFWEVLSLAGPVVALLLVPAVLLPFGGFRNFPFGVKDTSALDAFGILAMLCFPIAARSYANMKREQALARSSETWPTAPGVLRQWQVTKSTTRGADRFAFAVRYTYDVGGRRYESETLAYAPAWLAAGPEVDALVRKYRPDATVVVHYDPVLPARSVLETSELLSRQRLGQAVFLAVVPFVVLAATVLVSFIYA